MRTFFITTLLIGFFFQFTNNLGAQNVGINMEVPLGKLHIKGSDDVSQLIIDADTIQGNANPLLKFRNSDGTDLLWIHSDNINNVFFGVEAGKVNNASGGGINNSFIGRKTGFSNSIGYQNTSIGSNSFSANTTASQNVSIGSNALFTQSFDNGGTAWISGNVAVGYKSLYANQPTSSVNGIQNTAIGHTALLSNTTGYSNTAIGAGALYFNSTGYSNTGIGLSSLFYLVGGAHNVALGYGSGTAAGSPDVVNTISVGNYGYLNAATNQAFIGNLSTSWTGGNTTWFTYASDGRVKNNVNEDVQGLAFISKLRPVTYNLDITAMRLITGNNETMDYPEKYDVEKIKQTGFIAQEVEQAAIQSGYSFSGVTIPKNEHELYTISYAQFVVPLVKAVQELSTQNDSQNLIIENLQSQNELLAQRLEKLELILEANNKTPDKL